jgi:HK97 family phage portal protein
VTLFSRIKEFLTRDIRNLGLSDPKAWNPLLWNLAGAQSLSGENVTESTALTYSAVWDAVGQISQTIASMPLHLMQRKGENKAIRDDRRLYRTMHDQWNPWMTAMSGRECLMSHILTWGNGYAEKVRNGYGEVVELWPITPNRVLPELKDGELVYRINLPTGGSVTLGRDKILHIPGLGFDGFMGYSVIAMARKSIGLGMAMETYGSLYFGQGTHPGIIVTHQGHLDKQGYDNLNQALNNTYSGLGNSHRLMLMEEGIEIKNSIGIPPKDSQFLDSRQFQIPEIARWYHIPPHKLKDLTKSSFNNIEVENGSYYVDCLLPWIVRLEQNFNMQLLSEADRSLSGNGRFYFKHVVEGILRANTADRAAFYNGMLDRGVFSINEVRAMEDRDPIEGGDIHLVPLNYQNLKYAGEKKEPAPSTPQLPQPEQIPRKGNGKDKEAQGEQPSKGEQP